jgi:hypothetical protein
MFYQKSKNMEKLQITIQQGYFICTCPFFLFKNWCKKMKLMHGEDEERNPFFLFKN